MRERGHGYFGFPIIIDRWQPTPGCVWPSSELSPFSCCRDSTPPFRENLLIKEQVIGLAKLKIGHIISTHAGPTHMLISRPSVWMTIITPLKPMSNPRGVCHFFNFSSDDGVAMPQGLTLSRPARSQKGRRIGCFQDPDGKVQDGLHAIRLGR
jgi:hypothetical protein